MTGWLTTVTSLIYCFEVCITSLNTTLQDVHNIPQLLLAYIRGAGVYYTREVNVLNGV